MKLGPGHLNILSTAIERSQVWDGEWIWISDDKFRISFVFSFFCIWDGLKKTFKIMSFTSIFTLCFVVAIHTLLGNFIQ